MAVLSSTSVTGSDFALYRLTKTYAQIEASYDVSALLPDLFTPVLVMAMFLLAFCRDRLHRLETLWGGLLAWVVLAVATTFLVVGSVAKYTLPGRRLRTVRTESSPL